MATSRGRRVNRVRIHTLSGTPTYSIGLIEAERLKDAGELIDRGGKWSRTQVQLQSPLSPVNLTEADTRGVLMGERRALLRVKHWPLEHDRRNVTVIAGRGVWIPDADQERIAICSKLQEQASHAKRYAATARN
jgi:hypothetical protein